MPATSVRSLTCARLSRPEIRTPGAWRSGVDEQRRKSLVRANPARHMNCVLQHCRRATGGCYRALAHAGAPRGLRRANGVECLRSRLEPTNDVPVRRRSPLPFHGTAADCKADGDGNLSPEQCARLCPADWSMAIGCSVDWSAAPELISCSYGRQVVCFSGRRPLGLQPPSRKASRTPSGRLLAEMAYLEAASVHAFVVLARELEGHGAPARLCAASRRAAGDEIRHAAVMRKLAQRAGSRVGGCESRGGGGVRSRTWP